MGIYYVIPSGKQAWLEKMVIERVDLPNNNSYFPYSSYVSLPEGNGNIEYHGENDDTFTVDISGKLW